MVVSSNEFPLGTELKLDFENDEYDGTYTVEDTGNMRPCVLDIFAGDYGEKVGKETLQFGRKTVTVEIKGVK